MINPFLLVAGILAVAGLLIEQVQKNKEPVEQPDDDEVKPDAEANSTGANSEHPISDSSGDIRPPQVPADQDDSTIKLDS